MEGTAFDELAFFRAVAASGARALLIGRRALVVLGLPVLTADYDFWLHRDDLELFNAAAEPFGLHPTRPPSEARAHGRYVLENDERVDVLCAREVPTVDGIRVSFDELWSRHVRHPLSAAADVDVGLPRIGDLMLTKRFGGRPKDVEDLRLLEILRLRLGEDA